MPFLRALLARLPAVRCSVWMEVKVTSTLQLHEPPEFIAHQVSCRQSIRIIPGELLGISPAAIFSIITF